MNTEDDRSTSPTRRAADLYAELDAPDFQAMASPRRQTARGSGAARANGSTSANLHLLNQLERQAREVRERAEASAQRHLPLPQERADLYDMAREHVPVNDQPEIDAIAWRHAAEMGIEQFGDQGDVREQSCPSCGCWGLTWADHLQAVACINRYCLDDNGRPTVWTLQQLAAAVVRRPSFRRTVS